MPITMTHTVEDSINSSTEFWIESNIKTLHGSTKVWIPTTEENFRGTLRAINTDFGTLVLSDSFDYPNYEVFELVNRSGRHFNNIVRIGDDQFSKILLASVDWDWMPRRF